MTSIRDFFTFCDVTIYRSYRATAPSVPDLVTPYDQAYYFYGAQNPLDPSFATPAPLSGLQSSSFPPPAPPIIQRPTGDSIARYDVI